MDDIRWRAEWRIDTYVGDELVDSSVIDGNILLYGGASNLWEYAIGNGSGTSNLALTYLNNGNAYIGVGDGMTATDATQTALQGSNTQRNAMDATYPQHTTGTGLANSQITFQSTFITTDANFAWQEFGLFNGTGSNRVLINRKVSNQGTKTSAETRIVSLTLSLV